MMKNLIIMILFTSLGMSQSLSSKQLIVVSTKNWTNPYGILQRYSKKDSVWHKEGKSIDVHLGRNGIGWGIGLHTLPQNAKIIKKEGDGKAPAGIFELKHAFGYFPFNIAYPYKVYKATDHCVDDIKSKLYNKIVDSNVVKVDYTSKEHMRFSKNYYKYGIVVNHNHINEMGAKKGAGSCIFIHIKKKETAGCTVMHEHEMKSVLKWLRKEDNPLLIQGTETLVKQFMNELK